MWYPASPVDCTHCRNLHVFVELEETVELSLLCCSGREVHEIRSFTASLVRFTEFLHQVWLTACGSLVYHSIHYGPFMPRRMACQIAHDIAFAFPKLLPRRLDSIMLQNLLFMLFGISPIFCLLCLFLCFLGMHYADNLYL